MINKVRALIAPVFALFLLIGTPALATEAAGAVVGQKAPDFTATDTNGQIHKLSDHLGEIVVLEWTNHQCPFVRKHYEPGQMQALQKESVDQGVVWLSIVSSAPGKEGHVTAEEANKIITETGAAATARILDESGEIGHLYGAKTTPHMFVIDKDGTLVYAGGIDDDPTTKPAAVDSGAKNFVRRALADLAAGRPVAISQSQPYGCSVKYAN